MFVFDNAAWAHCSFRTRSASIDFIYCEMNTFSCLSIIECVSNFLREWKKTTMQVINKRTPTVEY